jgi:hypothetical protein
MEIWIEGQWTDMTSQDGIRWWNGWQDRMNNVCNLKCKHWRLECVVTNKVMRKLTGGTAHFLKLRSFLSVVIYRQLHAHTCCRWTPFCSKVRNRDKLRLYLCQIGARVSTADLANQAVKHWRRGCRAGVTEIFSRLMYVNREACKSMIHLWSSDGTEELPDKIDESDRRAGVSYLFSMDDELRTD